MTIWSAQLRNPFDNGFLAARFPVIRGWFRSQVADSELGVENRGSETGPYAASYSPRKGVIHSYRDLLVWTESMNLAQMCYEITKAFPREEVYGMTSQVRRAAASVPANIAEGYGRENPGEFVRFLRIAQGSLKELETHLILASRVKLTTHEETARLLKECEKIGKMLQGLIRSSRKKALQP